MADSGFTAEEFETWMRAHDAFVQAETAFGNIAARTIVERLYAGLLIGRAKNFFVEPSASPKDYGFSAIIHKNIWKELRDESYLYLNSLWRTGDFTISIYEHNRSSKFLMYGVRFDPAGIREMFPPKPRPAPVIASLSPTPPPNQASIVRSEQPTPVSPAHLRQWYELYKAVTPENEQTEDHAWQSALGMFPGKSVSRAKIRELRGAGALKRGPKPKGVQD